MLDFDLAELYQVETRRLNEAVKRNIKRFPHDFMFQLTHEESADLKSQIATSSWGGSRKLSFAFTEQGVSMLSSILRSDTAIEVNISIMRAFVTLRQVAMNSAEIQALASDNGELRRLIEDFIEETEGKFDDIYVALSELAIHKQKQKRLDDSRTPIGYKIPNP